MNYMADVAKLLGLELGEKFKINSAGDISSDEYYIDEISIHEVCDGRVNDYCYPLLLALLNGTDTVVKLPKSVLTEQERHYLSEVIKPFKDRIIWLHKYSYDDKHEAIAAKTKKSGFLIFPTFEKGMMYKGVEIGKKYTLEELGL